MKWRTVEAIARASVFSPGSSPRGRGGKWLGVAAGPAVFVSFLALWWLVIRVFAIPPYLLPTPWRVAQAMAREYSKLITALRITGVEAGGGLLGGTLIGMLGAVVFAQWRMVRRLLYPYALLLQTVPILAVAPLILTWFGNGEGQVTLIAAIICVFPILANTTQGLISVERNLLDLFFMHNASWVQVFWRLKLPHALPGLFTGLRIASGLAVIGAITGELFAGSSQIGVGGLGYSITYANSQMETDYMFALALMSSLLGFAFFFVVVFLEWVFLHRWHESTLQPENE